MAELEGPTLNALVAETGDHMHTTLDDAPRLRELLGVQVEKECVDYRLVDWGPAVKKAWI